MFDFYKEGYISRDTYLESIIYEAIKAAQNGDECYDLPNDISLMNELEYIRSEVEKRM